MTDERVPLIAALIIGMLYVVVTPPFRVPDEVLHFWRADAIAMGHFLPNGGGKPDSAQIPQGLKTLVWVMSWEEVKPTRSQLRTAYEIPLEPIKEPMVQFPAWYTPVPYVPQALAVLVGRLLNVRPFVIFYLGRLANLFLSIALLGLALHFAEGLRPVIVAVVLLPMTLFELASWSADAMTFAASILLIVLLVDARRTKSACAAGIVVALCKPAYFLTAFLARRRMIIPLLVCVIAGTLIAFAYAHRAAYQQRTGLPIDPASQLQCIVSHPLQFASVVAKDVARHGWYYVEGAVAHLGLADARLPLIVTWIELVMLVAVGLTSAAQVNRLLTAAIFLATALGIMLSQYLIWSVICGDVIEGVQGRYFLPVLPFALISMRLPAVRRALPMWLIVGVSAAVNLIALLVLWDHYWR